MQVEGTVVMMVVATAGGSGQSGGGTGRQVRILVWLHIISFSSVGHRGRFCHSVGLRGRSCRSVGHRGLFCSFRASIPICLSCASAVSCMSVVSVFRASVLPN